MDAYRLRLIVCFAVLCGLLAVVMCALVLIVGATRDIAANLRRLHQQQVSIIRMMLRAGFRPPHGGRDWFDDANKTQAWGARPSGWWD